MRTKTASQVAPVQSMVIRSWVENGVEIHDHFDGSAHCVQCEGPCNLDGEKRLLTEVIRWMFERWARGYDAGGPDMMQRSSLAKYGVRIEECYNRAVRARMALPDNGQGHRAAASDL